MSQVRAHVFIDGQVQGVGYRYYTRKTAIQLNLKGWVRNLSDGRVEAVFEGETAAIDRAIRWCQQGSPAAVVQQVAVEVEVPEGLTAFEIVD